MRRLPVLVLLVMAGVGLSLAVDAFETRDPAAAVGALVFTAFTVFLAWRSATRRRK